ncbi:hypothetical protein niasHS_004879 [Heterodera schachtii]|uniref:RING-type domain-containing protein n=1 Tax=Heterodera schachtii TaxID=97005 RepID=A0ABD2JLH8_HETSC
MNIITFIALAFSALFNLGLALPNPTPENENVQQITNETESSVQVQNPLIRAPFAQQTVADIAHPTTADENESSGEAQTAQVSGPSGQERAGENTPKNGENSQPSKELEPREHKEAIALPKKPSPKIDWEKKNEENAQTSKDPPTSAGGQDEAIPSPKKPSPKGKSKSDFGLNLAKAFPGPVPKGNVENTRASKDSASEAHKEVAKEKNEENAQTSKDPGSQNEAIPSPKKPSPKGKSKSNFDRNLAKAFPRPVPKAKVGKEAQCSKDPTMNGQICAICLDSSLITDLELSECHHRFHRDCVDGWFKNNDTCPTCRNVVASRYLPRPTRTDRIFDSRIETKRRFMGEGEGKYTIIRADGSTLMVHDNHFGNNFTVERTEEGSIQLSKNDRK